MTLLEILVVLAISAILVGVVGLTLKVSLEAFNYISDSSYVLKVLDDTLSVISDGDFENYGIKDSFEIIKASSNAISFVPPWIDDSHFSKKDEGKATEYILNRPFKAGSTFPIAELVFEKKDDLIRKQFPITLALGKRVKSQKPIDKVTFNKKVPPGKKIRFIYHPDIDYCPECIMTIELLKKKTMRYYKNRSKAIQKDVLKTLTFKDIKFQYYDNRNTEILPKKKNGEIPFEEIPNISAVKTVITVSLKGNDKTASTFINLRNTLSAGGGFKIREGIVIDIPNSESIKIFSLVNVGGIGREGFIRLLATSESGQTWAINVKFGYFRFREVIKGIQIEYPQGNIVYSRELNYPLGLPLNFLTLDTTGRYDYDFDEKYNNVVNLKGKVKLKVTQMDAAGASLYIRP